LSNMQYKSLSIQGKQDNKGTFVFKISTNQADRDEDILEPQGVQLDNYRKNPIVLFGHDYKSLPIGKSLRETVFPDYIESEVEFAPTEFAQQCKQLCEGGFLNAASVRFMGIESEDIPNSKYGKRYKKWDLLEWSVVPLPSNFGSLCQRAKAAGINTDAIRKELKILDENELKNEPEATDVIEKSGASISAKNKETLQSIHDDMHKCYGQIKGCRDRMKEFLADPVPPNEDEPPEDGTQTEGCKPKDASEIAEIKEALAEIKQVLFLLQKNSEPPTPPPSSPPQKSEEDNDDDIDIDALVDEVVDDDDNINIKEEELEKALNNILDKKINQIKGGN
jgi:hypothetical protein